MVNDNNYENTKKENKDSENSNNKKENKRVKQNNNKDINNDTNNIFIMKKRIIKMVKN